MKKILFYGALLAMPVITLLSSCSEDKDEFRGEGRVFINTAISSDVKVVSRDASEDLASSCIVWISSEKGLVRKYEGINNVPADGIKLVGGRYIAEAWAGDSVSASWDARYYKGRQEFTVTSGDVTVNLQCKIANVLASVKYAASVDEALSDYKMTVSHDRGSLTFEGKDERVGSFMMPSTDKNLAWKLEGKDFKGNAFVKEGVIENVQPAHQYVLNVKYTPSSSSVGGGFLTIEVDDTEVVIEDEITIVSAPQISGYNFDIDQQIVGEAGNVGRYSVIVAGATELKSVILASADLASLLAISGNDVDLLNMTDDVKNSLDAKGLDFIYTYDAENDLSTLKVNFEETLTAALAEGEHVFNFKATDKNGKFTSKDLKILVSNASVSANATIDYEVWPTSVTLRGNLLKSDAANPAFKYRKAGASAWTTVAATVSGNTFSAQVTGLTPGTKYEYVTACDGYESSDVKSFTTQAAATIPNGDFETWNTSGKAYLLAADESSMFWDSGNHGSATMNKNITQPESAIKHGGNYSAKLQSQFVGIGSIGKFAAGNAFVGKYLATEGTDGVLGWGRPFTSRPAALKVYVKYTPGTVAYTSGDVPGVAKGDKDKGIIYLALLDGTTQSYNSYSFPVIVKTKASTRQLFDKNASNVIAYGEKIFTEATSGEGLIEVTIPLDYKKTNVIPSNLMIVCSASKDGDYFVGGNSVMYIDDMTFVYE